MIPHLVCYLISAAMLHFHNLDNKESRMHGSKKPDAQMTREEFKKLKKSMKDEKFHELLGDYMKEISDPNNVDEYDRYLEQLKGEGELPEGMELIRPQPEFVIRSSLASKTDKKYSQNMYINICSHPAVSLPESKTSQNGQTQWSVPYFVGKTRYDQEEGQVVVNTVDVVFNPQATDMAKKGKEYHRIICETAVDASQAALADRKETVNKDYTLIRDLTCKGARPALLPVTLDPAARERAKKARLKHVGGKAYTEIEEIKEKAKRDKESLQADGKGQIEPEMDTEEIHAAIEEEPDLSKGPIAPKYSLVYSYPVDLGNFGNITDIYNPINREQVSHIKLQIQLPLVNAVDQLHIDLKPTKLQLTFEETYFLDINFIFEVDTENAKAKFVAGKKMLDLNLPIVKRVKAFVPFSRPAPPEDDEEDIRVATQENIISKCT